MEIFLDKSLFIEGQKYYICDDSAYILRPWLQVEFSRSFVTPDHHYVYKTMSSVRVSVEHSYKYLKQICSSQHFKIMLKVRQAPIALIYKASPVLWNSNVFLDHGR